MVKTKQSKKDKEIWNYIGKAGVEIRKNREALKQMIEITDRLVTILEKAQKKGRL